MNVMSYRHIGHDTFRKQVVNDVNAKFHSWSISNDIRLIYLPTSKSQSWRATPQIGISWEHFERESYSEPGGMSYGVFDTDLIQSIVGLSAEKQASFPTI